MVADPLFGEPPPAADVAGSSQTGVTEDARRSIVTADNLSSVYFAPLAGTGVEARAIKCPVSGCTAPHQSQATKGALARAEAPRMLHIATHGFFFRTR